MAGVEENDIDRLLANPPEKIEMEVKYKIAVTVMEGVSQTIWRSIRWSLVIYITVIAQWTNKTIYIYWLSATLLSGDAILCTN